MAGIIAVLAKTVTWSFNHVFFFPPFFFHHHVFKTTLVLTKNPDKMKYRRSETPGQTEF